MKIQEKSRILSEVGKRIRFAREKMGFRRQTEFGRDLGGFTLDQISRAERGDNWPPHDLLLALARVGINLNYLFTGNGSLWSDSPQSVKLEGGQIAEIVAG